MPEPFSKEQRIAIFQRLKDDFKHFAPRCLKIRTKDGDGAIAPFTFNKAQEYLHARVEEQRARTGKIRAIVLKGRQQRISTYVEGRFYWKVVHRKGVRAFILTHDTEATDNLFGMVKRYHDNCHPAVKPQTNASNAKELVFGILDSGYKLGTAGNKGVGRSQTIQYLHGSEVAIWPNASEHAMGVMQAVPSTSDTEIFLESTAKGMGNYFHEQWQLAEAGMSDFIPIFIPWFWDPGYVKSYEGEFSVTEDEQNLIDNYQLTNEQLNWRRYKIVEFSSRGNDGVKSFMTEYPCTSHEAFQITGEDSYILPDIILPARKCNTERYGLKLLGVDPARFGDDRTAIIRRQGRVAYDLQTFCKLDTMQVVGIIHNIIRAEGIDKCFIDIVGLGVGIYDRLVELGHSERLVAVSSGNIALDEEKFLNRRAEMWFEMKEWLREQPAQIPDSDELHSDLASVRYSFDSKGRLKIEKKEDMKKRGLRSPDAAEALLHTFYYPATALHEGATRRSDDVARQMMSQHRETLRAHRAAFNK